MASERKIAANRLNARKSTGPRTARGRSRASGNAWRHGWSVAKIGQSAVSADVERMAKAICGEHATPALYEQAAIIAECEIVLLNLRCARVAAIERSIAGRKLERPNQRSDFSTHKELSLTIRALASGDPRPATRLLTRTTRVLRAAMATVASANARIDVQGSNRTDRKESSPPPPICLDASNQGSGQDQPAEQVRDELDAFQHALPELISLESYERRIMSRRTRAIRMFEAISTVAPFLDRETKGS